MEFIKELHEARLTRASGTLKTLTYSDCCERAYLSILILEVLRRFPGTQNIAKAYAKQTAGHDNYKHFRMTSTDLYNFVYFIVGDNEAIDKLKDPGAAKKMRAQTQFPLMAFNRYVSHLSQGFKPSVNDQQTLINIEGALRISNADYKSVRRKIYDFNQISSKDRKEIVTRLILAARAKLRSSDIISHLEELSTKYDLEVYKIYDPEPTVSTPDITVSGKDMISYRYLVGDQNVVQAKRFLDLAKNKQSIPASLVQAYLPAIAVLDDIVKAGPGFVQQLRLLANRAKKSSNR